MIRNIVLFVVFLGFCLWLYCHIKSVEGFDSGSYEQFYYKLQSKNLSDLDKCKLATGKLKEIDEGHNVSKNIHDAARNYVNNHCSIKPKSKKRVDIDPKSPDSLKEYYNRVCVPEYGEQRDKVEFDKYDIFTDVEGNYYLDNERIDQMAHDSKKCRRLEEFIKNNPNGVGNENKIGDKLETLDEDCKVKFPELVELDKVSYKFHLTKDGKYYVNDEPLDQLKLTKKNCQSIGQLVNKPDNHVLEYRNLNDEQKDILCKRTNEMDYICNKWDTEQLKNWGKQNEIGINLYEYEVSDGKYEYSFMDPSEHYRVSRNISKGKSGLPTENERVLCYRKMLVDQHCGQ